jgi:signal peptidase I
MSTTTETSETTTSTEEQLFAPAPKQRHPIIEIVQFALIALLIVLPIRMFIAQPFIVSGASMEETFHTGEYLIVDQVTYRFNKPTRGDVIIFRYPRDPSKFFIKRIIGLPGDTITIDGNVVTIFSDQFPEGVALEESYIKSMEPNTVQTETLGDREYFVMGDNRDQSSDSRVWGVLQEENIIGRALVRLFPVNQVEFLPGFVRYDATGDIINE